MSSSSECDKTLRSFSRTSLANSLNMRATPTVACPSPTSTEPLSRSSTSPPSALGCGTRSREDSALPDALGRRRARQGLRVDHFTEAVRINFRVLWRALHRAAQPDLTSVLMDNGERVLDVVERYATEVQRSFLNETEEMARSRRTARERALTKLFSGYADENEITAIATVLGMRHTGEFELIAVPTKVVTDELGQRFSTLEVHSYGDEQMTYLFRHRRKLITLVDELPGLPGGYIAKIDGIGQVPAQRHWRKPRRASPGQVCGQCEGRIRRHCTYRSSIAHQRLRA